ncbi:AraC family transcriptional regulator [Paenibacillus puerhi]|uniref:AraC family transcriptional regulator n=1 Tax=Paenibacillus puerhi TaxID=2692622 RepID=UPI001359A6F6|nr:AraC family transcriptional regulator [Paenibacillus puerhi]
MIVQITTPQLELWRIGGQFSNLPHAHEGEFQVTVPVNGTCFFTQENKEYMVAGGGGLVQHPLENHYFNIGHGAEVLIFKIGCSSLKELVPYTELEFAVRQEFDPIIVSGHFRRWMGLLLDCDPTNRLAQEETETEVLQYLLGSLDGSHDNASKAYTDLPMGAFSSDPYLRHVLEYIHAHYSDDIHIDELASIARQSRFHFIRSFKKNVGLTPYQYVLRLRIEEARRLLERTALSVTEISCSLGFSSPSQFYRAFARMSGLTPEKYRGSRT